MVSEFRSLAARANYLAADRMDLQYAVKELCREMARPTVGAKRKLKRLVRYAIGLPRLVSRFDYQVRREEVSGYSDSDWAGCVKTGKSTSGGVMMIGGHLIKSWSSTQKSITLSSGEAELVAAVKMSAELIGMTQLLNDWGIRSHGKVYVDSSAAIGIAQRRGNGKLRHVRVGDLWIQEKVEEGELQIEKVQGEQNPADTLTKGVNAQRLRRHLHLCGQEPRQGRAAHGLRLKT